MSNPYTENIKRGAALLDKERPGWRDEINLATLDLADDCYCVLGQIFGRYSSGLFAIWGIERRIHCSEWAGSSDLQTVVDHGFSIEPDLEYSDNPVDLALPRSRKWRLLQEAWVTELGRQRQRAEKPRNSLGLISPSSSN